MQLLTPSNWSEDPATSGIQNSEAGRVVISNTLSQISLLLTKAKTKTTKQKNIWQHCWLRTKTVSVQTHHAHLVHYGSLAKTANNQSQILQWSICKLAWQPGAIINREGAWLQCESCWPNLRTEGKVVRWWFDGALPNKGNWKWALMISGTVAKRSSIPNVTLKEASAKVLYVQFDMNCQMRGNNNDKNLNIFTGYGMDLTAYTK